MHSAARTVEVGEQVDQFSDWLKGRTPPHLSTNAGTAEIAFQSWRNMKEAFAPELVREACHETSASLGRPVLSCIDPFGGSGTTALASQFLGVQPFTIEVNPYLADLIEAKLCLYDVPSMQRAFAQMMSDHFPDDDSYFAYAPPTFVEPGVKGRYIFGRATARRLSSLRRSIETINDPHHRRLFRVLLGSAALSVSNVTISGKGRRYRRNWESREFSENALDRIMISSFAKAVQDITQFGRRASNDYEVIRGDARLHIPADRRFDLAICSPPYPNSFDYTDVYNVELWICGYLCGHADCPPASASVSHTTGSWQSQSRHDVTLWSLDGT